MGIGVVAKDRFRYKSAMGDKTDKTFSTIPSDELILTSASSPP
ncbi:hypothetical protein Vi05172_g316 [Venturia inaequalis]|nr:hypothetical protein Vi05172_g316 [Venturia inaequalis]